MWRRVEIVLTDVSEERITSIFRIEDKKKSTSKPAEQVQQVIHSSETSVNTNSAWRHIPEDGFLQIKMC
jgi:hypothetical protein